MPRFSSRPDAVAYVQGGAAAPELSGELRFYQKAEGILLEARIRGLPEDNASGFFALHIHEGESCAGADFPHSGGHYNPGKLPHPRHAGDLPPLLSCGGRAYLAVLTDRFQLQEIIGRTILIHSGQDDFHSQPAGNAGSKLACGLIRPGR